MEGEPGAIERHYRSDGRHAASARPSSWTPSRPADPDILMTILSSPRVCISSFIGEQKLGYVSQFGKGKGYNCLFFLGAFMIHAKGGQAIAGRNHARVED